jgi:predicted GNAT family N-acyltransferase
MHQREPLVELKSPAKCAEAELSRFCGIVVEAGEVDPDGLEDRVRKAEILAFLRLDDAIIAVGALKRQRTDYVARVFRKAEAKTFSAKFALELGWVVVIDDHRKKGYSNYVVAALVDTATGQNIYATSITKRFAMHAALLRYGFQRDGVEWESEWRMGKQLLLFVRHDPSTR